MDIVDTQVHFNQIGSLALNMAAMDAVGVTSVLFDDFLGSYDERGRSLPGYGLPNGSFRHLAPEAEAAAFRYPERFGVMRRVHYRDPELESICKLMVSAPYVNVLRAVAWDEDETRALAAGEYAPVFRVAAEYDLPLVMLTQGRTDLLKHYIEQYPGMRLILDHCGTPQRPGVPPQALEPVCELAQYENVTLKWSHAAFFLSKLSFPFPDVIPLLKRVIAAFGPERVMWGSDFTVTPKFASWAEELFYLRLASGLSHSEKEWVLGRAARTVLRWTLQAKPSS